MTPASDLHSAWARLFVHALAQSGVRRWVVSPGSRSTPLALAVAEAEGLDRHVLLDERSAAFFALGQARVHGEPSVLLCTSGTACAHYLPAIIEASMNFMPLIIVTADRPWELYDAAASQTIDQVKIFGDHVRHYAELGLPDGSPGALRAVLRIAAQAAHRARFPTPGAVHINARFRKPLEPVEVAEPEAWSPDYKRLWDIGPARTYPPQTTTDEGAITALAEACKRSRHGWLVCGPSIGASRNGDDRMRRGLTELARATGFILLPESSSGVRFGTRSEDVTILSYFDALLRVPAFRSQYAPDTIIEFGAPPVCASYATLLAEHPFIPRYVVAPHGWNDPSGGAIALIHSDPADVAERLSARLSPARPGPNAIAITLQAFDASVEEGLASELGDADARGAFSEGAVARRLMTCLPEGALLMVGNSLPIRHLDRYCAASSRPVRILHQRGAAGIDGVVSGAAGSSSVFDGPVVVFLGDLSMQHDLNGLAAARSPKGPLVIVVVQNNGGRIFELLPIAQTVNLEGAFNDYFITSQNVHFEHAARMFGHTYHRVESVKDFDRAMTQGLANTQGTTIIEACVTFEEGSARRSIENLNERVALKMRSYHAR